MVDTVAFQLIPSEPPISMAAVRPSMHTRDASGRQVSLLNDENLQSSRPSLRQSSYASSYDMSSYMGRPNSYVSTVSSPRTPDLLRADSYDSQGSNAPRSPATPHSVTEYSHQPFASSYPDPTQFEQRGPIYGVYPEKRTNSLPVVRPAYERPASFDSGSYGGVHSDRSGAGKRYPCRFKDSHGCDKTFTTSGHASRHSKIHTAEKAVHCSFQGCSKKFTRADNMKQHLETHFKERSRSTSSKAGTPSKLTMPSGVQKSSSISSARSASRGGSRSDISAWESRKSFAGYSPMQSPAEHSPDMAHFQTSIPIAAAMSSPPHARTSSDSYRLDALAAICTDRH